MVTALSGTMSPTCGAGVLAVCPHAASSNAKIPKCTIRIKTPCFEGRAKYHFLLHGVLNIQTKVQRHLEEKKHAAPRENHTVLMVNVLNTLLANRQKALTQRTTWFYKLLIPGKTCFAINF
jgi:hypothetical protein